MGEGSIMKLAEALDSYIPHAQARDGRAVSDAGGGRVLDLRAWHGGHGRVERGMVKVGEEIEIVGLKPTLKTVCTGVEMFRKLLDEGQAGDNIGVLLRGTKREEVERGQVLAKPASITPHTKFECEVYILSKEEGGRHTPFFNGLPAAVLLSHHRCDRQRGPARGHRDGDAGGQHPMVVTLIAPIAMEEGLRFAIREGGKTVGAGVVAKIIE